MTYQYFRSKLSTVEKSIYDQIRKTFLTVKPNVGFVKTVETNKIERIVKYVLQDNPQIFYIQEFQYEIYNGTIGITPVYLYSRNSINNILSECSNQVNRIISHSENLMDFEILLFVHDKIVRNVRYKDDNTFGVHSIVTSLTQKYGVCEGYAKTVKFILDRLKIPCIVIYGEAINPLSKATELHSWNMVKIYDSWCHFDMTFDATIMSRNRPRYDYFALTDADIKLDHTYCEYEYPQATNGEFEYYAKNNLLMNTKRQLIENIEKCLENGCLDFICKLSNNIPEDGIEQKVLGVVIDYFTKKHLDKVVQLDYNLKQRVFHIIA